MLTEENNFSTLSVPVVKIYPGFEVLDEKTYLSVMYYLVKNLIKLLTHLPVDKRATKISPVSTVTTIWWLFCLYFKIASMLWDRSEPLQKHCEFGEVIHQLKSRGLRLALLHPIRLCVICNRKCLFISGVDKVKTSLD